MTKRILTRFFQHKTGLLACTAGLAFATTAQSAVMVNALATRTIFDQSGNTGAGFEPGAVTPGTLDSNTIIAGGVSDGNLIYGDTSLAGDFARGSSAGGVTEGGFYDFSPAIGEPAIGIQPTDTDFNDGLSYVDILFQNNSGRYVNNVQVEGELWYLNNEDRANHLRLQFSRDGINFLTVGGVTSPEGAVPSTWNSTYFVQDFPFLNSYVAPGDQFTVRISGFDAGGTGLRDEFAFSDISVYIRNQSLPEPRTMGFLVLGLVGVRYARDRRQKYGYHDTDAAKRKKTLDQKLDRNSANDQY